MIKVLKRLAWCALWCTAAAAQAQPEQPVIVSLSNASEPFMALMRRAAEDEARRLGVDVVFFDGKANSAKQATDIENRVAGKLASGLVIAPNDLNALASTVNFALERGLPVVTVDRRVQGTTKPVPHVGIDNAVGGRLLAQWVVQNFPDGARVLHLTGQPGSSSGIDRARGVREGLAAAGAKYGIVGDVSANWSRTEAQIVTEGQLVFLKTPPDVIVADNDDMAVGALQGIQLAGQGPAGIKVIGFDALPFALQKMREGTISATVDQHGDEQMRTALRQLVSQLRTGRAMESVTVAPTLVTTDRLRQTP